MWLDPELVLDLANSLWLKDYICTTNPLYHLAKVSMSWCATFWESAPARSCSSSRTNWRPLSAQGEMPVCKTLPCRGARDPVLATPYWVRLICFGLAHAQWAAGQALWPVTLMLVSVTQVQPLWQTLLALAQAEKGERDHTGTVPSSWNGQYTLPENLDPGNIGTKKIS